MNSTEVISQLEQELETIDARREKVAVALAALKQLDGAHEKAPRRADSKKATKRKGSKKPAVAAAKPKSTRGRATSPDAKAQARQRWEAGEMVTKIIRETGIGGSTLYAYAKAEGWRRPAKAAA